MQDTRVHFCRSTLTFPGKKHFAHNWPVQLARLSPLFMNSRATVGVKKEERFMYCSFHLDQLYSSSTQTTTLLVCFAGCEVLLTNDKLKENKSQLYGGPFGSTNQWDDREEQSHPSVKQLGFNLTDDNIHTLQPQVHDGVKHASTSLPVHRFAE